MLIFLIYFLNKDISPNMRVTCLKTAMHVYEIHLEEVGDFRKIKINYKSYPFFCSKMKTRT